VLIELHLILGCEVKYFVAQGIWVTTVPPSGVCSGGFGINLVLGGVTWIRDAFPSHVCGSGALWPSLGSKELDR
jgi:hypothetical protein